MLTVKEVALRYGCSETIIYRHIKKHKDELGEAVKKAHGKTYITEDGVEFIQNLMSLKAPAVLTGGNEEQLRQIEALRNENDILKNKLLTMYEERESLMIKASQVALLEAKNSETAEKLSQASEKLETIKAQNEELSAELEAMKKASFWQRLRGWKK